MSLKTHILLSVVFTITMNTIAVAQCSVSDSALIAHYPFDGNANDMTIAANDGTVSGPILAPDRFGNTDSSYFFDGINDYITANPIIYSGSTASISVWIKPIEITVNTYYNITRQGPSPANMLLAFQSSGNLLSFGIHTSSGYSELDVPIVPSDYTDGQWHCNTAVYDGSQQRLYTDGMLIGSQPKTGTILNAASPPPFTIGSMNNSGEFFYGWMDDVKYYDRALTPAEASMTCNYITMPEMDLGNDTTLCQGESLTLDATTSNVTYLWQDNSTSPTFTVTLQGTYWVELTDSCGSTVTDTINVVYTPLPAVQLGNDTTLCQGEPLTLDATTSAATYLWQDNSTNPTFTVTLQGTYWVELTDSCGSTVIDTMNVDYDPLPAVQLGNDTTFCQGETLTLDATTSAATYLWQDNSTGPTFNVDLEGAYWVEVTNSCGIFYDTLIAYSENCDCHLYVPNTFTPDLDNLNDQFAPVSDCAFTEYSLLIFNRWGEQIFESSHQSNYWDGKYKGSLCQTGVYIYSVKYNHGGMLKEKYGHVTLLK